MKCNYDIKELNELLTTNCIFKGINYGMKKVFDDCMTNVLKKNERIKSTAEISYQLYIYQWSEDRLLYQNRQMRLEKLIAYSSVFMV